MLSFMLDDASRIQQGHYINKGLSIQAKCITKSFAFAHHTEQNIKFWLGLVFVHKGLSSNKLMLAIFRNSGYKVNIEFDGEVYNIRYDLTEQEQ